MIAGVFANSIRNAVTVIAIGLLPLSSTNARTHPHLGPGAVELAASEERLAEPPPAGAEAVRAGTLRDGDPIHRGSGKALLLKLPDGSHVVRLENLDVVRGPTLFVYLVAHEDPLFPEDVTAGFRNLGVLKSRFGEQNYAVPENVDLADYNSVVVWCETFKVQFAVAALSN